MVQTTNKHQNRFKVHHSDERNHKSINDSHDRYINSLRRQERRKHIVDTISNLAILIAFGIVLGIIVYLIIDTNVK